MQIPKIELTEDKLRELRRRFFPRGSGPLSEMSYVVGLIDAIAKDKGWDVSPQMPFKFREIDQAATSIQLGTKGTLLVIPKEEFCSWIDKVLDVLYFNKRALEETNQIALPADNSWIGINRNGADASRKEIDRLMTELKHLIDLIVSGE